MKEVFIKPKYYDKFKCAADKCLHSCCINWGISFDDETIKKYTNLQDENLSEYILNNISSSSKKATLKKGYCPFLDSDSLCKIQKQCGEDYLCETCKFFPRIKRAIANITKFDIDIACPEVLKIIKNAKIFSDEYIIEFQDKECELLQLGEYNKKYFIELFNKLQFIYNKKYDYKKSMFILLHFAQDSSKYLTDKTDENFNTFKNNFNEQYFLSLAKKYLPKKNKNFFDKYNIKFYKFADNALLNQNLYNTKTNYSILDHQNKKVKKLKTKLSNLTNKLFNLKNVLFYIINLTITESIRQNSFLNNTKFAIINIMLFNLFAVTQQDITKQKTINNLFVMVSSIFRGTYHSKFFDKIEEIVSDELFSTETLLKYISSF